MPWCPNCKNEYREGITVCADCGCVLVEKQELDKQVSLIFGEETQMTSLKEFLEFNGIEDVVMHFDEREQVHELFVKEKDFKAASGIARVFLEQENQNIAEGERYTDEGAQEKDSETQSFAGNSAVYKRNADKAEDNRSSAWTLLVVGGAGMFIMILGIMGILPLSIGNPYMFYGVMSAVFLLFMVMGVVSMKNAKIFEKKAESENTLREALEKWCRDNLRAEEIDRELGNISAEKEEVLYFKRYEKLKEKLNHQFMNLDQAFLDNFIDETVYDMVFGSI